DTESVNALISLSAGAGLVTKTTNTSAMTLQIGSANGSGTFSGVISNATGALALVKAGNGTQTITSANTYTGGTTVTGGALIVANTTGSATGTGAVTVGAGASLGGTGTVSGAVTLA